MQTCYFSAYFCLLCTFFFCLPCSDAAKGHAEVTGEEGKCKGGCCKAKGVNWNLALVIDPICK